MAAVLVSDPETHTLHSQPMRRITYSEIQELKDGKLDWRLTHPERAVPPSPVARGQAPLP